MRYGLNLSTRLTLVIVALIVTTAVIVGYRSYANILTLVIPRTLARLDANAQSQATAITNIILSAQADVKGFRSIIGVDELMQLSLHPEQPTAGGQTLAEWRARIGKRLAVELEAKPDLVKYRLIGVADGGREIIRAERQENGTVRVVPDDELQRKGERDFFEKGLTAPDGAMLISPVELNQDHGRISTPHMPVVRVSTPLFTQAGERFGLLIVNIDLRPAFARLSDRSNPEAAIYVVNDRGDYLTHTDPARAFGFEFGKPFRIQDDLPRLATMLGRTDARPTLIEDRNGVSFGVAAAAVELPDGKPLTIVEAVPEARMLAVAMGVWRSSTLVGGAIAVVVGIILAIIVSRTLTKPLTEMTRAVESFGSGAQLKLPLDAGGEIGVLARAFKTMVQESRDKTAALRHDKDVFESIMNTMAEAVLLFDSTGTIIYENPTSLALREAQSVQPRPAWEDTVAPFLPDGVTPVVTEQRPSRRALRGESVDRFEMVWHILGTDRTVQVSGSARPIRAADGTVSGAVVVLNDITLLKEAERKLHQAQKLEAIGQLTGGVAHDFNNMLTVISGTAEILLDELADRPDLLAIAKMIDQAAERGADLTRQLLAFARKQPLQPKNVDVNAIVTNIRQLLRPTIGEHIDLDVRLEQDADPAHIDPSQLSSALLNLAVNARDAMPNGGKLLLETGNVVLDEHYAAHNPDVRPGRYVLIAVSDTGTGMPQSVIDKAFEPFFTTKGVGKGTGLGLSMVYGFVRQSGGHVKIYSEEGHGSTIKLYLPRADADADALPAAVPVEGGSETVLLVEDDELVRTFAVAQLQGLGYRVIAVADGAAALAVVERGTPFDLLLTDVIMPGGLNGRQLADAVAKLRPVKVLYTSGYTENAIVHHGRLDAGVMLLTKPFRRSDLARLVRAALEQGVHRSVEIVPPRKSAAG